MTRVRVATREDRQSILQLHIASIRAFGPEAYDERQVAAWAEKDGVEAYPVECNGHHLVVAVRDTTVVGYGHLVPDEYEVRAVYVDPDHTGLGVGSALLANLEGYAMGTGLPELRLWASRNAVGFYERMGYEPVGETTLTKTHEGEAVELGVVEMRMRLAQ